MDEEPTTSCEVPRSTRAAWLAGVVVACVRVGLDLQRLGVAGASPGAQRPFADAGSPDLATAMHLLLPHEAHATVATSTILVGLLSNGFGAIASLLLLRRILNAFGRTSRTAYAVAGGGGAVLAAVAAKTLGIGATGEGYLVPLGLGAATAFLFRTFAGVERASAHARRGQGR